MSIPTGSRYEQAEHHFTVHHYYDQYGHVMMEDQGGTMRFVRVSVDTTYMLNSLPSPPLPPAEYYAKDGEHMAFLAYKFMEDSTRWWEIAEVNPEIWYPLDIQAGSYIRLPS